NGHSRSSPGTEHGPSSTVSFTPATTTAGFSGSIASATSFWRLFGNGDAGLPEVTSESSVDACACDAMSASEAASARTIGRFGRAFRRQLLGMVTGPGDPIHHRVVLR